MKVIGCIKIHNIFEFIAELKDRASKPAASETENLVLGDATSCRDFMNVMVDDASRAKLYSPDANKVLEAHIGQFMRMVQPFIPHSPDGMPSAYKFMTAQVSRYCLAHPTQRLDVGVNAAGRSLNEIISSAEAAQKASGQNATPDSAANTSESNTAIVVGQ